MVYMRITDTMLKILYMVYKTSGERNEWVTRNDICKMNNLSGKNTLLCDLSNLHERGLLRMTMPIEGHKHQQFKMSQKGVFVLHDMYDKLCELRIVPEDLAIRGLLLPDSIDITKQIA